MQWGRIVAGCWLALLVSARAGAERVPLDTEGLQRESTHIVAGQVKGVYSRDAESTLYGRGTIVTRYIVEIEIKDIEKGDVLKKGDLVYARCWSLKKRGEFGNRPGPSSHSPIPREGNLIRAYLARGKYSPTGQEDNGYAVVYPNGIELLQGSPGPKKPGK
jgi:hypothetical protein